MKILYLTTVGSTMNFFRHYIKMLIEGGHTVDIATNEDIAPVPQYYAEWGCKIYCISCSRTPLQKGNLKAISQIRKLVFEGNYDIVHCHTPVAAMCTRIACRKIRKSGIKVIYTAHGFHFYKGAPLKNWLLYFSVEWFCSFWTDVLITINKEDFKRAQKYMHARHIQYVPGVGIDVSRFYNAEIDNREKRRFELGVPNNGHLLLSVGELNENKNHQVVIEALKKINNSTIHYAIAGKGKLYVFLQTLVKSLGLEKQVHLLGYCDDMTTLYKLADAYVLPSFREGLNVSMIEAMASGIPILCSDIRGNSDIIDCDQLGFLCNPSDSDDVAEGLKKVIFAADVLDKNAGKKKIIEYDVKTINNKMMEIYETVCEGAK